MSDDQKQLEPLEVPKIITPEWVIQARDALEKSTWLGVDALKQVLPKNVAVTILGRTERLLKEEGTLLEVRRSYHVYSAAAYQHYSVSRAKLTLSFL